MMSMKASTKATAISSPTKSAQTTESTIEPYTRRNARLRHRVPGGRFLARGLELAQPVLERTAAVDTRPRRMESTPMIVPTAVSRKTGATASWISRVTSMTFSGFTTEPFLPAAALHYHRFPQLVLEMVDVVEARLQFAPVLCGERFVALFCHRRSGFNRGLVDALDLVVTCMSS